jgi:hypothetical protein
MVKRSSTTADTKRNPTCVRNPSIKAKAIQGAASDDEEGGKGKKLTARIRKKKARTDMMMQY